MANKPFDNDIKVDVIPRERQYVQESFDLSRLDDFVAGLGVEFLHYKATPSPIGKNDRGDYRRNDGVDTITSNGMIYKLAGQFRATMTDNSRERDRGAAGTLDPSESKLVMPRFYNKDGGVANGDRIYLLPGDRIYVCNPKVDDLVVNAQWIDYEADNHNVAMFPIVRLDGPIIDSRNIEYTENVDFQVTKDGNVCWLAGGKNPGIDPNTGKGRIYSIRYLYKAYWYITQLPKEVRITNVTNLTTGEREPERAAYHAIAQREYIYHNQNKGNKTNQLKPKEPKRTVQEPNEAVNPAKYSVPVDMSAIGDDDEQS